MVGWLSLGVGYIATRVVRRFERKRRPSNGPDPIYIQRVFVATDLVPLISGLEKEGISFRDSQLWIFGSDGRYVVKNKKKRWRRKLSEWSAKGLHIKYIILDADDEVRDEFQALKDKMEGRFDAVCLNKGAVPDLARELETCHPTLFIGPDNKNAAWIERLHPRDSACAYNVKYVSPNAMCAPRERAAFDAYKRKLEVVLDHSQSIDDGPLKVSAPHRSAAGRWHLCQLWRAGPIHQRVSKAVVTDPKVNAQGA